jgi:hypothetical protein
MSGMHLLPVYYSTTNTRKRKQNKKSASVLEAERQHTKFLKKMGLGGRSSVGRAGALQASGQRFDPARLHHSRSLAQSGSAPALGAGGQKFESSNSDQFYNPTMAKPKPNIYSGERKLIGIATMHKSNSVPIFEDNKELAIEIARMRR